jgi:translocation and assembly module TamA
MLKQRLFFSLLCLLYFPAAQAGTSLTINGLDGELRSNVDTYLTAIEPEEYSTSLRFRSRLEKRIKQALRALGYYHPIIQFRAEDENLSVTVKPGEPSYQA